MTRSRPTYRYQSGGSLDINAPTYVVRQADIQLLEALRSGEFCYVLNARQMGKSSMLFRTIHQLRQLGHYCVFLDMTRLGSESVQPEQWYRGIVSELCRSLNLSMDLPAWWRSQTEFSPVQRLSHFLEDILLVQFPQEHLFIFIDEIDSIFSLSFSVDDFFALIRFCFNQRVLNPAYNRLTFALFGVTTPSSLIQDLNRTPFNIGRAIALAGFQLAEAHPLGIGLTGFVEQPQMTLQAILNWTQGQPFLTQKLCQLIVQRAGKQNPAGAISLNPTELVASVVQTCILENWEMQDNPEHLRTIRDRIERNQQQSGRMLSLYQQLLQGGTLDLDDSREQAELLLSGLV
ncbi:MAG TPA: AAA-like domain-containing protein, partial [Coleofasciculaceae cyanobacterium]